MVAIDMFERRGLFFSAMHDPPPFFYDLSHKELGHELIMFQAIRSKRASSMMEISLGANYEGRKEGRRVNMHDI